MEDQFAFRPTGSTTAALISILHHVTTLLQTNDYVAIISLDLSKAFDTVRHSSLTKKLATLDIPDNIYNWLVNFLEGRIHVTKFWGKMSNVAAINASIVQGSGVGPPLFDVNTTDLHPVYNVNKMPKFADDTYLIIGSSMRDTVAKELENVSSWALKNNLPLNHSKSKELIIARRGFLDLPSPPSGVLGVTSLKIFGVILTEDLRASSHVSETLLNLLRFVIHVLRPISLLQLSVLIA